ncbi:CCAAT- binding transcription factor component [Coemansia sp. RSA 1807]|nr:CCAAT- binding transcription factor component [Coemansia sp. RSA 1591]KAJ1766520.1 CCAAT- binding transcription factor component [Coemansia sp. RSA 1752]KAJ1778301.1 CCAAT- binding transcription factor component [Coemansia sp. RSA 1824]KAJ1790915.1 CCAAT- binding transcription factor component [Coemansia sp. RSA 2167]KAJ1794370.1 CCAAT- binding transcription factor component [Coemansia sp. RSA 1938]KAJ2132229.1 CCAAT- binding transcription factor component [Coemansia sp. RSA 921]KAJ2246029
MQNTNEGDEQYGGIPNQGGDGQFGAMQGQGGDGQYGAMQGQGGDGSLGHALHDASGLSKFNLGEGAYPPQSLATAVAAAHNVPVAQRRSPAPMYPGASTIPTNFSSGQINSTDALHQFQSTFWKAHTNSIEDNSPDFKVHLLPLARIKKVMKSDPDVKVQMISAEAPILFSKACEIFITELTQRAWMNAEENKRRTLQRQDVSFAAQRSEMFDFLIDVVPREEFANKKTGGREDGGVVAAHPQVAMPPPLSVEPSQQPLAAQTSGFVQQQQSPPPQPLSMSQQQSQPSHQPLPPQPQASGLYNDPAFQQYYAQHLAEAAGFQQAPGPTPEQRQAYYQQLERSQIQWFQRQPDMGMPQPARIASSSDNPQLLQMHHDTSSDVKPDPDE